MKRAFDAAAPGYDRLLARWPRARLVLVDLSADMLDRARERFAGREDQVEIRPADYLADPLGGPYDAVVSALSIHHLPDAGKRALFRRAGFDEVDCSYRWLHFAVFGGRRPPVRRCTGARRRPSRRPSRRPRPPTARRQPGA